jgi:hypothetical protein
MKPTPAVRLCATPALALFAMACGSPRPTSVERDMDGVRSATVPADARKVVDSDANQRDWSVHRTWRFEVDWDWARYAAWARDRMGREGFREVPADAGLVFRRSLGGDSYNVRVTAQREGPTLTVIVEFNGWSS